MMLHRVRFKFQVSQRMLPFIHSTLNELKILELNCPEGSIPCWIFLCCLEVVQMCQKYAETVHVDACSYYTASLLEECSDKVTSFFFLEVVFILFFLII